MFQTLKAVPRLARIAQLGWKSGAAARMSDDMRSSAVNLGKSNIPAEIATSNRLSKAASVLGSRAENTADVALGYAKHHGIADSTASTLRDYASNAANILSPVVNPVAGVAKGVGTTATAAMMNPMGQMALFMGLPYLMMNGQEQVASDESLLATGYQFPASDLRGATSDLRPDFDYGLNEEQINKARRRAEEQAALNQFYAQALTQYQP